MAPIMEVGGVERGALMAEAAVGVHRLGGSEVSVVLEGLQVALQPKATAAAAAAAERTLRQETVQMALSSLGTDALKMKSFASAFVLFVGSCFGGAIAQVPIARYAGPALAQAVSWLNINSTISGSLTTHTCVGGGPCAGVNQVLVTNNTLNGTGELTSAFEVDNTVSAGASGNMQGTSTFFAIAGQPGVNDSSYVAQMAVFGVLANNGGTLGTPMGSAWAINPNVFLGNGATFWKQVYGAEIDVTVANGASVRDVQGLAVIKGAADAVKGSAANIGITLNNQTGAQGWDCGFCFGSYSGRNPMDSGGTLIGTFNNAGSVGGGVMGTVANGVDFRQYTFTGTPFGAPLMTPASSSATCAVGGIEWDAGFVYVCTAANTWKRAALSTF